MRIGLMIGASEGPDGSLEGLIKTAQELEAKGFSGLWMANIFGFDAISALSLLGMGTSKITLGTAVTPTYPRHPTAIAQQAMTAGVACAGRFKLGIGLSHKVVIENMLGFSYDRPAKHMREYLSVLVPLLNGETVNFEGEHYNVHNVTLAVPNRQHVPVLVAALGPIMLKLTGELADGTITWMTGPKTLQAHIVPSINAAAESSGKPTPMVCTGFPIILTNDPDTAREKIGKGLQMYGMLPSYRAMLDREGAQGPADVAIAGSEAELRKALGRLRDIGVTDFAAAISAVEDGAYQRTLEFLASESSLAIAQDAA